MAKEKNPAKKAAPSQQFSTPSDIEIQELYRKKNLKRNGSYDTLPGKYPFTRGIYPSMYRGKHWTMRQYAGFGTAAEANKRYHYLLSQGTTGLSVAFDLPTQMGRDSDHQLSQGEVGKVGVAISTVEDMHRLLKDIPLDKVSISMTINATAATLLAFLLVVADERGIAWKDLSGTVQNDILKEYIARGTYIYPPVPALRIVTDMFEFCAKQVPQWNTISISGYHIREAGSTAVDEVAFTIADGIAYVEAALKRGLQIDDFAPRLAFFFNCHNDFFEEIAKFRAARRVWATIMKQRFKAKNPRSQMLRFHTQTAGSSLTAQQPLNNVVRTSTQALAAVLGGTQSLHTNGYDEALGLPTEESATLALRTQQILAYESGVTATVDPLAGSYFIESLTDTIEQLVLKKIAQIDKQGGMVAAIEQGLPQKDIERAAYDYQRSIEEKQRRIVGVNAFQESVEREYTALPASLESEHAQVSALQQLRKSRSQPDVIKQLDALESAAKSGANIMPMIVNAVRVRATLGEISDRLRNVFGSYNP